MARALYVVAAMVVMAHIAHAGMLPPLTLPSFSMPNVTGYLDEAKASLRGVAAAAARKAVTVRPIMCPNGKPLVTCLWDVCKDKCNGTSTFCIPDYCGGCNHKCVSLSVPSFDIKVPELPSFTLRMPNFTMPKTPCPLNSVVDVAATAASLLAKNHTIACKACPEGSVSSGKALACTMCPPGTYADRTVGKCTKCSHGSYSMEVGAKECKPCAANHFAPMMGAFACIKCPLGFTAPSEGSKACDFKGF